MQLMAIPGRSGQERQVAEFIVEQLRGAGAPRAAIKTDDAYRRAPAGGDTGNLVLKLPGTKRGPRRMFTAHMDTVPICVGSRPVRRGNFVRSADPNTGLGADDRAGCAVVLNSALEILRQGLPHPPLTFCWFVQEETGLQGSRTARTSLWANPAPTRLRKPIAQTAAPGGSFKRLTTKGGTAIEVVSYTPECRIAETRRSHTSGGSTTTESFLYTYYTTCEQRGRLQYVTLRRQVDAGPWSDIGRAEFEYYGEADGVECAGDLKRIKVQVLSGSTWQDQRVYFFRYYAPVAGCGWRGLLKYVVAPEGYRRLKAAVGDPDTADDATVAQYADRYFEYDTQRRVVKEMIQGGSRTFTFSYWQSSHADGYNNWKTKTVETRPGGSQRIVYTNYIGQAMVDEFKSGTQSWINYHKFDGKGRQIQHATRRLSWATTMPLRT